MGVFQSIGVADAVTAVYGDVPEQWMENQTLIKAGKDSAGLVSLQQAKAGRRGIIQHHEFSSICAANESVYLNKGV